MPMKLLTAKSALLFVTALTLPLPGAASFPELFVVYFKEGHPLAGEPLEQALVDPSELKKIDENIRVLKAHPDLTFSLSGHVDFYECVRQTECDRLALHRAVLVYRYLVDRGAPVRNITELAEYDWVRPLATDPQNASQNRRVEMDYSDDPTLKAGI